MVVFSVSFFCIDENEPHRIPCRMSKTMSCVGGTRVPQNYAYILERLAHQTEELRLCLAVLGSHGVL